MKIAMYKGLDLGKKEYTPVTAEEVAKELENVLAEHTSLEVKEGKSELGDTVNIDYKGLLDDVAFEGGTAEKYDLELGSNSFIPGFEDQLVGYAAGSDVDVHVTFPEEYHAENLAGKAVVFKCHIHEVKVKVTPELTDEFAQKFGIPTAEALKGQLEHEMNLKKKNDNDNEYLGKLIASIVEASEIEITEEQMKNGVDEMYSYYEEQIAQYGMQMEQYLAMQGMSVEDFRNQLADQAMANVKGEILFAEIAKAEGFVVSDEEALEELGRYKDYYKMDDATFEQFAAERKQDVINDIVRRKTAIFLLENNK